METLLAFLITFMIGCLVLYLVWWIMSMFPLPEPAEKIKMVVFVILCLVVLLGLVTGVIPRISFGR